MRGAPALDAVLEAGEGLRLRVCREISDESAWYRRCAGGLKAVPLYVALRMSGSAERVRKLAEAWRKRPDGVEADDERAGELVSEVLYAFDSLRELHAAYRRAAFGELAKIRPLGDGSVPDLRFAPGSFDEAKRALSHASGCFPVSWLERSNAAGPLFVTMGGRGLYRSWAKPRFSDGEPLQPLNRARIRVERYAPFASALHELAHRAQDVIPGLAVVEGELYVRRTTRPDGSRAPGR